MAANRSAGTTLLDAIYEVSRGLEKRETPRAVIIPVITDGGDFANRQYNRSMDEVETGRRRHSRDHDRRCSAPTDDDELRNRARILSETTRASGGQRVNLLDPMSPCSSRSSGSAVSCHPNIRSYMAGPTR